MRKCEQPIYKGRTNKHAQTYIHKYAYKISTYLIYIYKTYLAYTNTLALT